MNTFDWKEVYVNSDGEDVTTGAKYLSLLGSATGSGTRENPIMAKRVGLISQPYIFGSGYFDITMDQPIYTIGQGFDTILHISVTCFSENPGVIFYNLKLEPKIFASKVSYHFKNCYILNLNQEISCKSFNSIFNNCQKFNISFNKCTFVESNIIETYILENAPKKIRPYILEKESLYINCTIIISDKTINGYEKDWYIGFNNCKFQIGNESSAEVLRGSNADELHQNFIDRCIAEGITPPNIKVDEKDVPLGYWIFSNTSIIGEYDIKEGSEIDQFVKKTGISLGYSDKTFKEIPITSDNSKPESFTPINPKDKDIVIGDNSITLHKDVSIIDRATRYIDSKIIWLGGKHKLTDLNIIHNLPSKNGLVIDSTFPLGEATTTIQPYLNYIVRSKSKKLASIKYNGKQYDTSLISRNNVFRGVDKVNTFESLNGTEPEVFPILDFANHNTVQMRIVSELPDNKTTSGILEAGYWYFVAPDDVNDTENHFATYNGTKRPCYDSFLADGTASVSVNGKCHLRRCWKYDYSLATDSDTFWLNKQKPIYFDVVPNDLRCLHLNNSVSEPEMQRDDNGNYIASGHPDFYSQIGAPGYTVPTFDIVGSFMQLRIPISTLNPM